MTYLPSDTRPADAVPAVITCVADDCTCEDRGGVIIGYADTPAEARQLAADNCPPDYIVSD